MRNIKMDPILAELEARVLYHASAMKRTLPEIRFFILDAMEFTSLLEKKVYPSSPVNIWEGKRMVTRKHRIQTGQESSLYYEVVQTGNPSYAYLNDGNSPMTQASVMAHVCGHCEFSELNVLHDSNLDRTEHVMFLVNKVNLGRQQMGERNFTQYWNAAESVVPLIAPNSQFNVSASVITERSMDRQLQSEAAARGVLPRLWRPRSSTLDALLKLEPDDNAVEREFKARIQKETLSRRGYRLRLPCQDVLGFLRRFAPASQGERSIMDYFYTVHHTHDFVMRTQIMNEGWAMYWEKKIMLELFRERAVKGIIDYARVFSGVCYPRPYYARNPYHLGFNLWNHIEEMYARGKICLSYQEETDVQTRESWDQGQNVDPIERMENLVRTVTDYEFLRRFLTPRLIHQLHLNRIPRAEANMMGITKNDIIAEDRQYVWVDPGPIKPQMLEFFTHFYQPRIYVVDTDFQDGGILLYHRDDGRRIKVDWIQPTLKNVNFLWKGAAHFYSRGSLHSFSGGRYHEQRVAEQSFDQIVDRMRRGVAPIHVDA